MESTCTDVEGSSELVHFNPPPPIHWATFKAISYWKHIFQQRVAQCMLKCCWKHVAREGGKFQILPTMLHVLLLLSSPTYTGRYDSCFSGATCSSCLVYGGGGGGGYSSYTRYYTVGRNVIDKYTYSCIEQRSASYSVHVYFIMEEPHQLLLC